jgi:adenosine kinase
LAVIVGADFAGRLLEVGVDRTGLLPASGCGGAERFPLDSRRVNTVLTGSIATDHLMTFSGRFRDSLLQGSLDKVSLSFLVEDLVVRRGGVAANIAFGMGQLGCRPVLVGSVGQDFADYRNWLGRNGVDTESVHVSETAHTARFVCTTDTELNQIASFYAGAMSEAREIELAPIAARIGGIDLVVISPNDPVAMVRHSDECRAEGFAFMADPSQQLAFMEGPELRRLVEGAAYLITNEYERDLLSSKTGWTEDEILGKVGVRLTTVGAGGVEIQRAGEAATVVPVVAETAKVDPTGVGDAFRAGLLAGKAAGLSLTSSARLGNLLAVYVLESNGTQEYVIKRDDALRRLTETYGAEAADELAPVLPS